MGLPHCPAAGRRPPDLIVTDLRMPVMDGIGLIEALRQVPALAAIPVVMMTAAREQGPVHRAIELGVTDYLLKPLQAERVADRLKAVINRVTRAGDGPGDDDRTPVLVADGNAEFRQFVATTLGPQRIVHQAPSGVTALQLAAETRPGIVLVGGELGLLGPALLMRKLRAAGEFAGTRIIAVVPKADTAIPEQADAVVLRTLFPEGLPPAAGGDRRPRPQGRRRARRAPLAARAGGHGRRAGVRHDAAAGRAALVRDPATAGVADDRRVAGDRSCPRPPRSSPSRCARTSASAAKIAAGMRRDGAPTVSEEEGALAAVCGRPRHHRRPYQDEHRDGQQAWSDAAPTRQVAAAGNISGGAEGRMQVTAQTADGGIQFVLQLTAARVAPAAAPTPTEAQTAPAPAS